MDDAHIIKLKGKDWFHFKGGPGRIRPGQTQWGVVIGESPTGPFVKPEANPLIGGRTASTEAHIARPEMEDVEAPPRRARTSR